MKPSPGQKCSFWKAVCLAQLIWCGTGFLLLLAFTAMALAAEDPDPLLLPFALCALYLSTLCGGAAAARFSGKGPAAGTVSSLLTALLVFLLSALPLPASALSASVSVPLLFLLLPAGALGGLLGSRTARRGRSAAQRARKKRQFR